MSYGCVYRYKFILNFKTTWIIDDISIILSCCKFILRSCTITIGFDKFILYF